MEPTREQRITLDELLSRVLDKGVLIHADILISVAGIPLIGVNLKAALASVETMLEYGMMKDLDQTCRNRPGPPAALHGIPLAAEETLAFETPGALYFAEGIYGAWRYGILCVTNQRLLLFHRVFGKVLFSAPLTNLRGIAIREGENKELLLSLEARRVVRIRAEKVRALAEILQTKVRRMGSALKIRMAIPIPDELPDGITEKGERITHHRRMWMREEGNAAWQAGHLCLTTRRLCWWNSFQRKMTLEIRLGQIVAAPLQIRGRKKVLDVIYENGQGRAVTCFSGRQLAAWQNALTAVVQGGNEVETCSRCGRAGCRLDFLERACSQCGWEGSTVGLAAC